jgi:hypothetical protein
MQESRKDRFRIDILGEPRLADLLKANFCASSCYRALSKLLTVEMHNSTSRYPMKAGERGVAGPLQHPTAYSPYFIRENAYIVVYSPSAQVRMLQVFRRPGEAYFSCNLISYTSNRHADTPTQLALPATHPVL